MSIRKFVAVSALGAGLSISSIAGAQQAQPRVNQKPQVQVDVQAGQAANHPQRQNNDQKLATCLAIANQEEIVIAKFAEEKTRNKEVKDFAEMLVKDHHAFLQKLQKFAPEASAEGYLDNQPAERTSATRQKGNTEQAAEGKPANVIQQTSATQEGEAGHLDFMQLHREIAEECIRSAKVNLNKKDAKEFDECFIGHQIAKHGEMKTKLVVFERHTSGSLKEIIAEGIETTEKHLKQAEKIMKKLSKEDSSLSSRERKEEQK